jgi:hypothetical protein
MGNALRAFFGQGPNMGRLPTMGPPARAQSTPGMQQAYAQQPGPVSFEDALKSLGPAMDNGQAYTNPQAYQGYQNAARAVGAMYGMQPTGYFNNARPEAFRPMPGIQQRPFNAQFREQFPGQGVPAQLQNRQGLEQRPFNEQFRAQFPGQGTMPAPNPTVR